MSTVEKIADYGLGSFMGEPLVMVSMTGNRYHLRRHGRIAGGATFTDSLARDELLLGRCYECFKEEP